MTKTRRIRRSKRRKMFGMIIRFRGAGRIRRTRRAIRTKESEEAEEPKEQRSRKNQKTLYIYIYIEDFKVLAKLEQL